MEQVKLYNGEPLIKVIHYRGVYRWATKAHAMMRTGSEDFVHQYMKSHGYKYKIVQGEAEID